MKDGSDDFWIVRMVVIADFALVGVGGRGSGSGA